MGERGVRPTIPSRPIPCRASPGLFFGQAQHAFWRGGRIRSRWACATACRIALGPRRRLRGRRSGAGRFLEKPVRQALDVAGPDDQNDVARPPFLPQGLPRLLPRGH